MRAIDGKDSKKVTRAIRLTTKPDTIKGRRLSGGRAKRMRS